MIRLTDKESGVELGQISEEQLSFLQAQLEEESLEDQDYYLNQATLDMFESQGADPALLALLREIMAGREELEIVWGHVTDGAS